jgi:DNA-binding NarL/FixJ family response regulator
MHSIVRPVSGTGSEAGAIGSSTSQEDVGQRPVASGRRLRVLLVDDNERDRYLLKVLLEEQEGIEVVGEASNAEEAQTLAEQEQPDIILMDIRLPRATGVEATRQINRRLPEVTIIGVSSLYTPHDYNAMITAGAVAFVRKEDAVEALYKTIHYSTRRYHRDRSINTGRNTQRVN